MRISNVLFLFIIFLVLPSYLQSQEVLITEQATHSESEAEPIDDIVVERNLEERRMLSYPQLREADVFWKKRIWRIIDIREKMNLHFSYPQRPLFTILIDNIKEGNLDVYADEKFKSKLSEEDIVQQLSRIDTVTIIDPVDYTETLSVVESDLDPTEIKRFRVKEIWYFDQVRGEMNVRILGIAPLRDITDGMGNFLYEQPMFWMYYPHARKTLSKETAYMVGNDAAPISWDDIWEMRYFSSYIYKQSNVQDLRIKDYLGGVDMLLEADKIKNEVFNYEHDLWTY